MISVLNFKPFDKGALKGFFDLRYHGLTIKGCRLMSGNDGLWFSFPQTKAEDGGETKYYDQMFLSPPEREHIRRLVMIDLQDQGHLERPKSRQQNWKTPEGQDLSEYRTPPGQDGIPF